MEGERGRGGTLKGGGRTETRRFLVQAGADTNTADRDGRTILHGAAERGNSAVVQLLLDLGLDPNDRHSDGLTPIHRACLGREPDHTETVRVLLKGNEETQDMAAKLKTAVQEGSLVKAIETLGLKVRGCACVARGEGRGGSGRCTSVSSPVELTCGV